ncbi:MAG TPA: hypothetical protein VGK73_00375 [Polyangiaceae bacterium]
MRVPFDLVRAARRKILGFAVLGALSAGAGCYSPTLPLPPPTRPDVVVTAGGEFRATGTVLADAQVFLVNERSGAIDGQWVREDGRYDVVLTNATFEDPMQIWYQLGTDLSTTLRFSLPSEDEVPGAGGEGGAAP